MARSITPVLHYSNIQESIMDPQHSEFAGSIPEKYDRCLGPILFDPYAEDIARRIPIKPGMSLLELACGTGIATRRIAERLPAGATITATDLNQAMLDHAKSKLGPDDRIRWQVVDAAAMPFADAQFDVVVCQFGLMFLRDKEAGIREVHRVIAPGGLSLFSVWDSLAHCDLGRIAHEVVSSFFEERSPTFYQVPFGYHDPDVIRGALGTAGFIDVRISWLPLVGESPSAAVCAEGLVEGNPLINELRERCADRIPDIRRAVEQAIAKQCGDHPVRASMQALITESRRP